MEALRPNTVHFRLKVWYTLSRREKEEEITQMARAAAIRSHGIRLADQITTGVLARTFPAHTVRRILAATGKGSVRQRGLPAHVVVYYVIALALYLPVSCREVLRCLLSGLHWLKDPRADWPVVGKSGISQARTRLGVEPIQRLYEETVRPLATRKTKGAWYRRWRLVSLDGSTLDLCDTNENEQAFGRPSASRGRSAFPQIRWVSLVENGTHVLFYSQMEGCRTGEITLAHLTIRGLTKGMLCVADRNFFGWKLWTEAQATGADLLWRVKKKARLPCLKRFKDGSYLSKIYPSEKARRHDTDGCLVRVIEYTLVGVPDAEPLYRVVTTMLDPEQAPAEELAALYHERWEIETAFDEIKTHLKGSRIVLRSKTPQLVQQEFYGLLLAHFAIRGLMHEAALTADVDPDVVSFVHAVRVLRRRLPMSLAFFPSETARLS